MDRIDRLCVLAAGFAGSYDDYREIPVDECIGWAEECLKEIEHRAAQADPPPSPCVTHHWQPIPGAEMECHLCRDPLDGDGMRCQDCGRVAYARCAGISTKEAFDAMSAAPQQAGDTDDPDPGYGAAPIDGPPPIHDRSPTHRHFRGGLYRKLYEAKYEPNGTPVIVYQSCATGEIWVRDKDVFEEWLTDADDPDCGFWRFAPLSCLCGEINARHCPVHQEPRP